MLTILAFNGCRSHLQTEDLVATRQHDNVIDELMQLSIQGMGRPNHDANPVSSLGIPEKTELIESDQPTPKHYPLFNSNDNSESMAQATFEDENESSLIELPLARALELAIEHSEFITDGASFLSPSNRLLDDPQFLQSKFDLEMQKSSREGVEAALADFDARIATGFQWGRNSVIQANSNPLSSDLLVSDNGTFYGRLDKPLMFGGTVSVIHNINYAGSSQSFRLDPRYAGYLRSEFRQPILAGRGRMATEIAGPNSYRTRQQGHGVALAKLAEQTAELELRLGAERLLKQTEELYWDYWLAYQVSENQQTAANSANEIWSRIRTRAASGLTGGGAADEAQAEENYFRRKSLAETARLDLDQAGERLKHAIGMSNKTNLVLLLTDNPIEAPTVFDIASSRANGLQNRRELAKQDLQINAIELQLFAAKQLNRPQLDLVSGVQFNGLGDQLFGSENGALPDFVDTDDVGWNVGFEFSMAAGFRRERLNVRYLRLLLTKARTARKLQEQEVLHEISYTAKSVEKWNRSVESAKQRLAASQRRLSAVAADFESGRSSLDLYLRSQDSVALAKIDYARSTTELTKAQLEFLFRQGVR